MEKQVKNQHYVPKMYIKRFSPNGKKISVWKLKENEILTRQEPGKYATRRYFYDTNEAELLEALKEMAKLYPEAVAKADVRDEQFVEKALSRVEGATAAIMDALCKDSSLLFDEANMATLVIFLHELAYRSEKYRDTIDNIRSQTIDFLNKLGVDKDAVEEVEKTGKEVQLYQLMGIRPIVDTAKSLIENYNWYIGTVPGEMKLLISDNPAQGVMLGFNDICFPLCGDKAIIFRIANPDAPILSKDMPVGNEITLSERSVFAYNAVQLSYAKRFMFGDKMSLAILKMISDNQGRIHDVMGARKTVLPF